MNHIKKKESGQIIIEAMVGMTIATVALLGILGLLSRSLRLNTDANAKFVASHLAAEGIEIVKNIIDTNLADPLARTAVWNEGIIDGDYHNLSYQTKILSSADNENLPLCFSRDGGVYFYHATCDAEDEVRSLFSRSVTINNVSADEIMVSSTVSWVLRGKTDSVVLEDHFFNWRK